MLGLTSEHSNHYPTQLREAISLLDHIINTDSIPPSSITLMGNSAGGNLLLGVLLHLSHPNPDVPPLNLKDGEQFASAVAISPWCTMDTSAKSMETNVDKDVLAASALAYWGRNFLNGRALDPWNSPLVAPADWWADLKASELLILYGEDEIMRDDTEALCERIKVCGCASFQLPIFLVILALMEPYSQLIQTERLSTTCEKRAMNKWP